MNIKLIAGALLSAIMIQGSCEKSDEGTPPCINQKITAMQQAPVRNPPGSVWQYLYNGQTVYYIPADCCDQYSELYDSKCNLICAPDGGLVGNGDGRCPDFVANRSNEQLIWQDNR
jgi:hypothetical protein